MSQRNPMNDRYQTDEHSGKTRKSAASAKPKTKAAATVHVQSTGKPKRKRGLFGGGGGNKQQSKADKQAERARRAELNRKYYHPPTAKYQRMRRLWWALIIGAIVCGVFTFAGQQFLPQPLLFVMLAVTYILAVAALILDSRTIRRLRREYQDQMESKSKSTRAAEKAARAAEKAQQEAAKKVEESAPVEEEQPKKRALFGSGFRLKSKEQKDGDAASEGSEAAEGAKTAADAQASGGSAASKGSKGSKSSKK